MSLDGRPWVTGQVMTVQASPPRLEVRVDGGDVWLPHVAGTYAVSDTVAVLRDPAGSGAGQLVIGKIGAGTAPAPAPSPSTEDRFTAVIRPVGSASYRTGSGWDRWTTIASSDLADLYQDAAGGVGPGEIHGLAWFGDLITGLGASRVESVTCSLVHNGSGYGAVTFTVQACASTSRPAGAPTFAGSTVVSSSIGPGGSTTVTLPAAVATGLADGTYGSLGLVGTGYGGLKGATHPAGMALTISYWKDV